MSNIPGSFFLAYSDLVKVTAVKQLLPHTCGTCCCKHFNIEMIAEDRNPMFHTEAAMQYQIRVQHSCNVKPAIASWRTVFARHNKLGCSNFCPIYSKEA